MPFILPTKLPTSDILLITKMHFSLVNNEMHVSLIGIAVWFILYDLIYLSDVNFEFNRRKRRTITYK